MSKVFVVLIDNGAHGDSNHEDIDKIFACEADAAAYAAIRQGSDTYISGMRTVEEWQVE